MIKKLVKKTQQHRQQVVENPTTPPKGNGENPTPPTEEGNNGNEPKQDGNNTGSGQTTTDDQNTKETTTVSEIKKLKMNVIYRKQVQKYLPTIGAGLAFVGQDWRIDSQEI